MKEKEREAQLCSSVFYLILGLFNVPVILPKQEPGGHRLFWKISYASNMSFKAVKSSSPPRRKGKSVWCLPFLP